MQLTFLLLAFESWIKIVVANEIHLSQHQVLPFPYQESTEFCFRINFTLHSLSAFLACISTAGRNIFRKLSLTFGNSPLNYGNSQQNEECNIMLNTN